MDMDSMILLKHLSRLVFAYLLASLATGIVVYISLLMFPSGGMGQDAKSGGIGFAFMVSVLVAYFAAAPAALTIAVGEFNLWRMPWYYAIAGSAIGFLLGTMFAPPEWFPWLGLGFGVVAGLIYWVVAGRKAGPAENTARRVVVGIFGLVAAVFLYATWASMFGVFFF
jgi:hypothetical protein